VVLDFYAHLHQKTGLVMKSYTMVKQLMMLVGNPNTLVSPSKYVGTESNDDGKAYKDVVEQSNEVYETSKYVGKASNNEGKPMQRRW
jgi:hypothetical protein